MHLLKRTFRWLAVSTVGSTLIVIGVVLLFLPGPGLLLIVAGLAVLSIEFLWAERLRQRALQRVRDARAARRDRRGGPVDLRRARAADDADTRRSSDAA